MDALFRGLFSSAGRKKKTEDGPAAPKQRLPKLYNSDWNTVVDDRKKTLFFKIFDAPQQASNAGCVHVNGNVQGQTNMLTQNKAKVKRQIMLQRKQKLELSKPQSADKEMADEEDVPVDKGVEADIDKAMALAAEKKDDVPEEAMEDEQVAKEREEDAKQLLKEQRVHDLVQTTKYSEFY